MEKECELIRSASREGVRVEEEVEIESREVVRVENECE